MVGEIASCVYPKYISVRLLGYMIDGKDDLSSQEVTSWAPAYENYTFSETSKNRTSLNIEVELLDEYYDMFAKLWPLALAKIKYISENIIL